jgi:hypothetical protein
MRPGKEIAMLSRVPRTARAGLAAVALAVGGLAVTASPAAAEDRAPCVVLKKSKPRPYCPISAQAPLPVPVYAIPFKDAPIIGYLNRGGYANWFVYQTRGGRFDHRGHTNDYWAYTKPDRSTINALIPGQMGYVPEVYFRGGGPNEPDGTDKNKRPIGPLRIVPNPHPDPDERPVPSRRDPAP